VHLSMTDAVQNIYESSKLAKFEFQPYWPEKKLRVCVTGAGGKLRRNVPPVAIVISATVRGMPLLPLCWRRTKAIWIHAMRMLTDRPCMISCHMPMPSAASQAGIYHHGMSASLQQPMPE
jgi:hypothetical protein